MKILLSTAMAFAFVLSVGTMTSMEASAATQGADPAYVQHVGHHHGYHHWHGRGGWGWGGPGVVVAPGYGYYPGYYEPAIRLGPISIF